jgi:glycosyltransferase involved in cell wall biosynthesis
VQRIRRLGLSVDVIEEADDEAAVRELAAWLRRNEIDLVHAHMFRAEVVGTRAALAAGTPVIMATVHSSRVRSPEDVAALAALTPAMDRLIVPSESIWAKVAAEGRGGAGYTVIPNGVDLSRFSTPAPRCGFRSEYSVPDDAPLFGVVARLEAEKGHAVLLEAWESVARAVPGAWLAIVGEGSEEASLRARVDAMPAAVARRVIFAGRREDVSALTAQLSVAVLPSLREAQGISLLEAMARRVPVVASRVGGIPEVVTDGVDGLLVSPSSPSELADALVRLACSPELRARLGEAGYDTVRARFSIDAQVRRIQAVYDEELQRSGVLAAIRGGAGGREPGGAARSAPSRSRPDGRATLEVPPV